MKHQRSKCVLCHVRPRISEEMYLAIIQGTREKFNIDVRTYINTFFLENFRMIVSPLRSLEENMEDTFGRIE